MNRSESEYRSFAFGALFMLIVSIVIQHNSPAYDQLVEIKKLKTECEKFLPRNEHCKIVLMPTSKD